MTLINEILSGGKQSAMRSKALVLGAVAVATSLAVGSSANAAVAGGLSLTLSEPGFTSQTITDALTPGQVVSTGSFGDFTTNIVVGVSNYLATNSPSIGQLQVNSLEVKNNNTSAGSKVLTILLQDSSYNFPGTTGQSLLMTSSLGGAMTLPAVGDTVTFQSTATPSVGLAVTGGVQSFTSAAATAGTQSFTVPTATKTFTQTGSYSLSSQIVASFTNSAETINLSGATTVGVAPIPEPAGISMLAVAGAGFLRRRRRQMV